MSRLGKLPIELPVGTTAKIDNNFIVVKGPKGELKQATHNFVKVDISDKSILVTLDSQEKKAKSFWGLYRTLINNMVIGVNAGYQKKLEINGVGYKVALQGRKLVFNLGFSHPVNFPLPDGINAQVEANAITVSGIDKQLLGEISAQIRGLKKPEPYKGKGIKYSDEIIRRKSGKSASKGDKK